MEGEKLQEKRNKKTLISGKKINKQQETRNKKKEIRYKIQDTRENIDQDTVQTEKDRTQKSTKEKIMVLGYLFTEALMNMLQINEAKEKDWTPDNSNMMKISFPVGPFGA